MGDLTNEQLTIGLIVLGVIVILAQTLRLDNERWWTRGMLVPFGEQIADVLRSIAGDKLKEKRAVSAHVLTQAINERA